MIIINQIASSSRVNYFSNKQKDNGDIAAPPEVLPEIV